MDMIAANGGAARRRLRRGGEGGFTLVEMLVVITIIALLYAFIPDVSRAYWIFAVMATQVYLIMYLLMFVAASRLRAPRGKVARATRRTGPCRNAASSARLAA